MGKFDKWEPNINNKGTSSIELTCSDVRHLLKPGWFGIGSGVTVLGITLVFGASGPLGWLVALVGGTSLFIPLAWFAYVFGKNKDEVRDRVTNRKRLVQLEFEEEESERLANIAKNKRIIDTSQAVADNVKGGLEKDRVQVTGSIESPKLQKTPAVISKLGEQVDTLKLDLPDMVRFHPVFAKANRLGSGSIGLGVGIDSGLVSVGYTQLGHTLVSGETDIGKSSIFKCIAASEMLMGLNVIYYAIDLKNQTFNRFGVSDRVAKDVRSAIDLVDFVYNQGQARKKMMDKGYDSFYDFIRESGLDIPMIRFFIDELITLVVQVNASPEDVISKEEKAVFKAQVIEIMTTYRIYGIFVMATVQNVNADNFPGKSTAREQFKTSIAFASKSKHTANVMLGDSKISLRNMKVGQAKIEANWTGDSDVVDIQTAYISPAEMKEVAETVDVKKYFPEPPVRAALPQRNSDVKRVRSSFAQADIKPKKIIIKDLLIKAIYDELVKTGGCQQEDLKIIFLRMLQGFDYDGQIFLEAVDLGYDNYIEHVALEFGRPAVGPIASKVFKLASNPTKTVRDRVKLVIEERQIFS